MKIDLPCSFELEYPEENRSYYSGAESSKKIIHDLLKEASNGYCMYCGTSLDIERMDVSQIEHSVDKNGEKIVPLTNCKYNLAIACKDCNMKYKKQVKKANLTGRFKEGCSKKCSTPCKDYIELKEKYIHDNRIILQPAGVKSKSEKYGIKYYVFRDIYSSENEDENINAFIQQHIIRFHLNGEKRSRNIIDICADVVELNEMGVDTVNDLLGFFKRKRQINVIGQSFVELLNDRFAGKAMSELVDFCKTIVLCSTFI